MSDALDAFMETAERIVYCSLATVDRRGRPRSVEADAAILALGPDRRLTTLLKDPRLRWPDGFSFGPDGWLYVTCSSLQHVMFRTTAHMKANAHFGKIVLVV